MRLDNRFITDKVADIEANLGGYYKKAVDWENVWKLKAFKESRAQALAQGREQVVLPDPYNVVNLAARLLSPEPDISVPSTDVAEGDDKAASARLRFLEAVWSRSSKEQRKNVIRDLAWFALVRGRMVLDVRWIRDSLPDRLKDRRFPILVRALDPLNCGFEYGPFGPQYAFHKYEDSIINVSRRWPTAKLKDIRGDRSSRRRRLSSDDDDTVEVVDFWYQGEKGDIWNCVLVEGEFVKKPAATDYPEIPIVEAMGEGAPLKEEEWRGLSLLFAVEDLWRYNCRLTSQIGTGMLWYFWPALTVTNEFGMQIPDDLNLMPGTTNNLPRGTRIDSVTINPNVPLAETLKKYLDTAMQQSTFPGVMYGEAPGSLQAGYGISILTDAARGRVNQIRESLEWLLSVGNEIALGLVEVFAPLNGLQLWAKNRRTETVERFTIRPSDIDGFYENSVSITPGSMVDIQQQTLGLRLAEGGAISKRTLRQKYLDVKFPEDEEERIRVEQALMSPEIQQLAFASAMEDYFGPGWKERFAIGSDSGTGASSGAPPGPPPAPTAQSPTMMVGPMGGGIPPELQGQLTPEMLNPGINPNTIPPEITDMIQGGGNG